ncbi:T9SS type A sorting domain-containing protein [bacterium]|nr:T9SS type A sorting domain-containing protein [bacterium]
MKRFANSLPLLLLPVLLLLPALVAAQSSSNYVLVADVFDNGGGRADGSSNNLASHSIVGQAAVHHTSASANYEASSGAECMFCDKLTGTAVPSATIPMVMRLYQNYPNPFNPSTTIRYSLERGGTVELSVYNLLGERIDVLVSEYQNPGDYQLDYNAAALQSGVYIYRLQNEHGQLTKRMVLMK